MSKAKASSKPSSAQKSIIRSMQAGLKLYEAKFMHISTIRALQEKGYIRYDREHGHVLTDKGREYNE